MKMNPKKMESEIMNEGSDSFEEELSDSDEEVELHTPALRRSNHLRRLVERYSPPDFILLLFYPLLMMDLDLLKR